ncbi:hypothetical protein Cgig2_011884 [Carnegiea gigantea]|uniref:Uncharacterized protein n=1 Tax=Carnegiea gigantea TaxID=171969 RepID=A0A9Q1K7D9_9CARY|nr:hypothetical protein Cgig2_011884 [Carnegiea gigantea]
MKVASTIVRRIRIDTRSSIDVITWDCLKKLTYPGRDIIPLAKNIEVDFLVVDVPTVYNIIIGRPTLHRVKVVIAPYLLQLQFEADDGSVGMMQGDQRIAWECYLVSIRPLVERANERGLDSLQVTGKKPQTEPLPKCGSLIFIPLTRGWDELYLFGVPAFSRSPLAFLHIADVGLKVVVLLKIRGQCHQDLVEEFHALIVPPRWPNSSSLAAFSTPAANPASAFASAALALESASFSLLCMSFFSVSQVSFSSLSLSQWRLYLAAASSDLRRPDMAFIARMRACKAIQTR